MSVGEIVLLIVGFVEFVIILIVCSKGTDLESTPGMLYQVPQYDFEKDHLRNENYTLHKKLRDMEYKLYYDRPYGLTATEINAMRTIIQQPVEVNIENIIKVSTNE
jgi:hypothetical protein